MVQKALHLIFISLLLGFNVSRAQVTIGTQTAPKGGSLLDLKQDDNIGKNSDKGLLLPRVSLIEKKNLYPMFDENSDYKDTNKETQDKLHIGLLVYNVNKIETELNRICPGVHTWNGEEWMPIIPYPDHASIIGSGSTEGAPANITMTDADGNIYPTKFYGKKEVDLGATNLWSCDPTVEPIIKFTGKYWTTVNMHVTKANDGSAISPYMTRAYLEAPNVTIDPDPNSPWAKRDETYFKIDASTNFDNLESITYTFNGVETTISAADYKKKFGLSYSYEDAQKICNTADGWRQSNYTDWQEFAGLYNDHGGANFAEFGDKLKQAGTNTYLPNVKDLGGATKTTYSIGLDASDPMMTGFNALPVGGITISNDANFPQFPNATYGAFFGISHEWWLPDYGSNKQIMVYTSNWLASSMPNPPKKNLLIMVGHGLTGDREYFLSVRCVKDYVKP